MRRGLALVAVVLCLGAARGTLDELADTLAARIAPARGDDVAIAIDAPSPRLAADLTHLLAGRLLTQGARTAAPLALSGATNPAAAVSAARRGGFEELVRIRIDVTGGQLRADGSVLSVPSELWGEPPIARAHLYAETRLDDELRAYLPPSERATTPQGWRTRSIPLGDLEIDALAVGAPGADGVPVLAGATPESAIVWRLEGGSAIELRRIDLRGPLAPIRPRADVVTLRLSPGVVEAHASPFASGARAQGAVLAPLAGFSLPGLPGECALAPGFDWFTAESCGAAAALLPPRFYAAVAREEAGAVVVAAACPPAPGESTDVLFIRAGAAAPFQVKGVGAQVALASLDHPGAGEVVVSSEPSEPGEPDAIVIRSLQPGAPIVHRVSGLPGQVRALAAGDLDGDGHDEIVAAVRDAAQKRTELWIVD